jgi:hypothetical protein
MSLVLTELTNAGIAMAADSAISMRNQGGLVERNRQQWSKLLRVPSIWAAVSYWGVIGAVTPSRFDHWLQRVIDSGHYTDLNTFADVLVEALNNACHGRPLANGNEVGIHVAGYYPWADGVGRPFFFHVHNGHAIIRINHETDNMRNLIAVHPRWDADPRSLFEKHQDFPALDKTIEQNLEALRIGYITRNGDYFFYSVIADYLYQAFLYLNLIPEFSIPRDPLSLSSRKGFIHTIMEIMIRFYGCSTRGEIIGRPVSSLGIGPDRYVV